MKHHAGPEFWRAYAKLPKAAQDIADKNFALLKSDPRHPSLHFKKAGRFWSVRADMCVKLSHETLAISARVALQI